MYTLGAIKNTKDNRDIALAKVQAPVALPTKHITDISHIPVMNQLANGSCVGHAHALIHIYNEYKENKKLVNCSPRYLYALSKKYDNYIGEGTYPRTTAKIQVDKGCATEDKVKCEDTLPHADYINITEEAYDSGAYKMKGYAFVPNDKEALKQAIYQNGLVAITISVGNFDNPIKKGSLGLHRVVVYGYDGDRFFYRNSWGAWGDNGNGYFDWADQELYDIMTFVDLPNEIKEEAKKGYKYFSQKEVDKFKLVPELWKMLDEMRDKAGTPFVISSGFRTLAQNLQAGGKPNSSHLRGLAVDIKCDDNFKRAKMLKGISPFIDNIFLEMAPSHIHIDIDSKIHPLGQVMHLKDYAST